MGRGSPARSRCQLPAPRQRELPAQGLPTATLSTADSVLTALVLSQEGKVLPTENHHQCWLCFQILTSRDTSGISPPGPGFSFPHATLLMPAAGASREHILEPNLPVPSQQLLPGAPCQAPQRDGGCGSLLEQPRVGGLILLELNREQECWQGSLPTMASVRMQASTALRCCCCSQGHSSSRMVDCRSCTTMVWWVWGAEQAVCISRAVPALARGLGEVRAGLSDLQGSAVLGEGGAEEGTDSVQHHTQHILLQRRIGQPLLALLAHLWGQAGCCHLCPACLALAPL